MITSINEFKMNEDAAKDYLYYKSLVDADKKRYKNSTSGESEMNMDNLSYNRKMMNKARAILKKAGKPIPKVNENIKELHDIYQEGWDEYYNNTHGNINPYPKDSEEAKAWDEGNTAAFDDEHSTDDNINENDGNTRFNYMMLNRLQSDCEYFLNWGKGRSQLHQGTVEQHIQKMKDLWNLLEVKPEWLSMEEILQYETDMLAKRDEVNKEDN